MSSELIDKNAAPYSDKGGYFAVVLEQILSKYLENYCVDDADNDLCQMWQNLLILLRLVLHEKLTFFYIIFFF